MPPKPSIASPEIEFDSRNIAAVPTVDWAPVVTWPDTSGQGNDGAGGGSFRRFEERGWGGTEADVRLLPGPQDHYSIPGTDFSGDGFTLFAVLEVRDITGHLAIIGSDGAGGPGSRLINLFVLATGSIVFDRALALPYDCVSATGVIVAGTKYVITARFSTTTGMIIRVNGVEVANEVGRTQSQTLWLFPSFGVVDDQSTGGVGRIFGDKRFAWCAGYSDAASDAEITDMEGFLGDLFSVPGVSLPATSKATITMPEFEYDRNTLSASLEADVISTWADTSGEGNDATATGLPEYEAGAWGSDNLPDVRFKTAGIFTFDGTPFIGQDVTLFFVVRLYSLTEAVFIGGSSATALRLLFVNVNTAGAIQFSFALTGGVHLVKSADGVVVADGSCHVYTCRFTAAGGKIIRRDGVEVASKPISTSPLVGYDSAKLGLIDGVQAMTFGKMAWVGGYSSGASLVEMQQMEAFLDETFCNIPPPNIWQSCGPFASTVWTPKVAPSTVWAPC